MSCNSKNPDLTLSAMALISSISLSNMGRALENVNISRDEQRYIAAELKQHAAELREAALREMK